MIADILVKALSSSQAEAYPTPQFSWAVSSPREYIFSLVRRSWIDRKLFCSRCTAGSLRGKLNVLEHGSYRIFSLFVTPWCAADFEPTGSLSSAATIQVGQAFGAHRLEELKRGTIMAFLASAIIVGATVVLFLSILEFLVSLFVYPKAPELDQILIYGT